MGEAKEGAHPRKQPGNLAGIRYSRERASLPPLRQRGVGGPGMTGPGLLDEPTQPAVSVEATSIPEILPKKRTLTFRRGASYYSTDFLVPRTRLQAGYRKAGELVFDEALDLHKDSIVWSDGSHRWITYANPEHETKLFGQFVKALVPVLDKHDEPVKNKKGESVTREVFISLNDRSGLEEGKKTK